MLLYRPSGVGTVCIRKTGRLWQAVVGNLCSMEDGLLISSDWLRPVTRGAWRAVHLDRACEPNPVHGPGETR